MSYVTGPCNTLPGSHSSSPSGVTCVNHSDRPAIHRVQGETDSFGCEGFDFCQECYDLHKERMDQHKKEAATGICDWCGEVATDLRKRRDFEEGSCGRLYDVCGNCVRKENEACQAELEEYGDGWDWDD